MNARSITLVGFDLDGTLLDTSREITASVNHALGTIGRATLSREQVVAMVGGGTEQLMQRAAAATGDDDPQTVRALIEPMKRHYDAHLGEDSDVYSGLKAALDQLSAAGLTLACATNKRQAPADRLLRMKGLRDCFDVLIGGDSEGVAAGKPAPDMLLAMMAQAGAEPAETIFVGDSAYDVKACRAAGILPIALSFGFGQGRSWSEGAAAVIDSYEELPGTVERLVR